MGLAFLIVVMKTITLRTVDIEKHERHDSGAILVAHLRS